MITGTPRRGATVQLTFTAADEVGATTRSRTELVVELRRTAPAALRARGARRSS
jgi:hypothetical protein